MDKATIERAARSLQLEIYQSAKNLYPSGLPPFTQLFAPDVAARICGYEYELRPDLGQGGVGRERFQTAGILVLDRQTILISTSFPYETRRFTGAHEIGHIVLHPGLNGLHRDRPLSGDNSMARSEMEREADYFAAYFLAPPKLVRTEFEKRFGKAPVALTHTVAFHLRGASMHELLNAQTNSLVFPAALASAMQFGGRHFKSIAAEFGMSVKAMALRLQELGLTTY